RDHLFERKPNPWSSLAFGRLRPLIAARIRSLRLLVRGLRIDDGAVIAIMVTNPGHPVGKTFLIAALGGDVEEVVGADQDVETAAVGRIGVEDVAGRILVEHAGAGSFIARE